MGELYFNCTLTKLGNVWIGVLTITLDFIILMMSVPLYFSLLIIGMKSLKESWTILFWKKSLVLEKVCEWVRRIFVLFCFRDKLVAMMLIKFYVTGFWKLKTISTFFQLTQSESIANVSWSAMVTTKVQFDTVSAVLIC